MNGGERFAKNSMSTDQNAFISCFFADVMKERSTFRLITEKVNN